MRVVVVESSGRIELINRQPARLALEEPGDCAVFHCANRRVAAGEDIDRFVATPSAASSFGEASLHRLDIGVVDRQPERMPPQLRDRVGANRGRSGVGSRAGHGDDAGAGLRRPVRLSAGTGRSCPVVTLGGSAAGRIRPTSRSSQPTTMPA